LLQDFEFCSEDESTGRTLTTGDKAKGVVQVGREAGRQG